MTGLGSSCGACKFLRRKCTGECVFAPYFCYDQAADHFAAVHKVFGASNVSKLLLHLPVQNRSDAAITMSYEALARMRDPVYGCFSQIFALQQQVPMLLITPASHLYLSYQISRTIYCLILPCRLSTYKRRSKLSGTKWLILQLAIQVTHSVSYKYFHNMTLLRHNIFRVNYQNRYYFPLWKMQLPTRHLTVRWIYRCLLCMNGKK